MREEREKKLEGKEENIEGRRRGDVTGRGCGEMERRSQGEGKRISKKERYRWEGDVRGR